VPGIVYSIAADNPGSVWISHRDGLFHLVQANVVERIPWASLARRDAASTLVGDPVQGGLWLGFREGGVVYFKDRQLRESFAHAEGLGAGPVNFLHRTRTGGKWSTTDR
jgi:ligand-binding sensor domain-containing protein